VQRRLLPHGGECNNPGKGGKTSSKNAATAPSWAGRRRQSGREEAEGNPEKWGTMPEKDRARAIVEITKDLPARYRVVIEEYFKSLSSATASK